MKKDCLKRIGYLDESIKSYQEWDTAIRLAKEYQFIYVDEPLFVYTVNMEKNAISTSKNANKGYFQVVMKHKWCIIRECGIRVFLGHIKSLIKMSI